VADRFPLYTDADIHGPVVEGLRQRGRDVRRAVDRFPERTSDLTHFEEAARLGRVLVSNDSDMLEAFEELARREEPFAAYPVIHVTPRG